MSIVYRAFNMISNPRAEWEVIAKEPESFSRIFFGYAMILAAIPALCEAAGIQFLLSFYSDAVENYVRTEFREPDPKSFLISGLFLYSASNYAYFVITIFLAGASVNITSAIFDGWSNIARATQLVAYASTPIWVVGVVNIVPFIGLILSIPLSVAAAIYVVYLFHMGLGPVLRVPPARAIGMTVVAVLTCALISTIVDSFTDPGIRELVADGLDAASSGTV